MNISKTLRTTITFPAIIMKLMGPRSKFLGYRSVSAYLLGLVLYDLWCRKSHSLTLQIVNEDNQEMKEAVFSEIEQSFGKPEQPSSYFEHRLSELAEEIAKKKS